MISRGQQKTKQKMLSRDCFPNQALEGKATFWNFKIKFEGTFSFLEGYYYSLLGCLYPALISEKVSYFAVYNAHQVFVRIIRGIIMPHHHTHGM